MHLLLSRRFTDQVVIKLSAPIVVENLLTQKMKYKLIDKATGNVLHESVVHNGRSEQVFITQPKQDILMTIQIQGMLTTTYFFFFFLTLTLLITNLKLTRI